MTGEKLEPLVIGKFLKPRCFNKAGELPVDYRANSSAWMTTDIFTAFLLNWNKKLALVKRKILLFLDNCSAHPNLNLSNITICFFPPNTTSVLQPLDQGVINSFKVIYKRHLMSTLIHQIELGCSGCSLPNVLEAMYLIKNAWDQVKVETAVNCFKKSFFLHCETTREEILTSPLDSQVFELIEEEKDIVVRDASENKTLENVDNSEG